MIIVIIRSIVKFDFRDARSKFIFSADTSIALRLTHLMGMWYGAEIIDHQQERHFSTPSTSCPIIHISEYRAPITENPLYRNYNYSYGYGTGKIFILGDWARF
ncbi:hypothetical protein NQ317_015053 [Molorchus minor]|uniref:Uncharacterized protein n=1 Tax=Molorchus minor TaxID=1323400 RepID=A0ABQ9K6N7_9CUCU|nr:hypothetical protein NQ317_015053 [Molorchus minor]